MICDDCGSGRTLDVATISRADHWVDDVLPRFVRLIDENSVRPVRKHLLLIRDESESNLGGADWSRREERLGALFDRVVTKIVRAVGEGPRLLEFDRIRAGLVADLGLREVLYLDSDTDVVEDLGDVSSGAPHADLLWVANPLVLEPVVCDLVRHGFEDRPPATMTLLEPGFLYLRRNLLAEFDALVARYPDVNTFAAGSTYWNMLARILGPRAARISDDFNCTFWDVPAAVNRAKTVHFTGRWKHLQPYVSYDRAARRIVVHADGGCRERTS